MTFEETKQDLLEWIRDNKAASYHTPIPSTNMDDIKKMALIQYVESSVKAFELSFSWTMAQIKEPGTAEEK